MWFPKAPDTIVVRVNAAPRWQKQNSETLSSPPRGILSAINFRDDAGSEAGVKLVVPKANQHGSGEEPNGGSHATRGHGSQRARALV